MEKNGKRLHGGMRTEANGGEQRHGRPGCARRHGCPGRARRAHRPGARGCAGGPAISSALFQRRPGVQERAAAGFTASSISTRCTGRRAGSAGKERRAAREGKGERTARRVRPRRNRAGRAGARSSWLYSFPRLDAMRTGRAYRGRRARKARGVRGERRKNGAMRPPAQEQGRIQRAAAGNKAARNRRNRRGRDARTGVGGAEGKAGRKSKERCGGSSREQEQPRAGTRGMSRAWPPPGSAGCARKRVEIEGTARRFAWARPSPGSMGKGRGVVLAVWMDGATVCGIRWRAAGCRKRGAVPGAPPIGRKGSALLRRPCRRQRKRRCPCRPAGQKDAGKVACGIAGRTAG